MANNVTLSNMSATFAKDSSHLGKQDPYLDLEFAGKVYKTTMVKGGGVQVAWSQPILLEGAGGPTGSILKVVAKAHKALMKDKTLGEGTVDLAAAARSTGLTTVPLTSVLKGGHAGQVFFNVAFGTQTGGTPLSGHQGTGNVVEDVGGVGRNVEGGGMGGGPGMGATGAAATGAGVGGIAGKLAGRHHNEPGYNNTGGVGGVGGAPGGYNNGTSGAGTGMGGGMMGGPGGNQMIPQQGGGIQGQQGGFQQGGPQGGALPGGALQGGQLQQGGMQQGFNRPQEVHESHSHNVHDHNESESSEVHRVG
mmetsp:Transcript_17190/g.51394  ORF Transcript_17190/g.51394 Transcript_17190/m.51394 type:complete len:306 (-) Transcript_17190:2599-3516(-)